MGHLRVYTISDVLARFKRMCGYDVIHPMGWDAFGLPAENAAIERKTSPAQWTLHNIEKMKELMQMMLADFDWDREINTSSPEYYKWTQKIFLLLYERGLVYRKEAEINWDPVDMTVLANEQVDAAGRSWRSGAIVEKRNLEQWFIGITKYAEHLDNDLQLLTHWPEKVKTMQQHWIGKSFGLDISFPTSESGRIEIFTSRPETLFSVQFLALALTHPLVLKASKSDLKLRDFLKNASHAECDSKQGYRLKIKASTPIDVHNNIKRVFDVPVFAASYVLGTYGHAAVMGCPAHDIRDFEFWQENCPGSPVRPTISGPSGNADLPYTNKEGILKSPISLGSYLGMLTVQASQAIFNALEAHQLGSRKVHYRLRDWLISRQRYWGAPIPMIHCPSCGIVPVPKQDLPVTLPPVTDSNFEHGNPLNNISLFVNTKCPSCGGDAKRDTDTMDTFMDSSWYFFRYLDLQNTTLPFTKQQALERFPVDIYIGGVEHAILHLLYSRFISKFLADAGLWDGRSLNGEPIRKLVTQGMVHGKTFTDPSNGRFLTPQQLESNGEDGYTIKETGIAPIVTYQKMSKSKYNGADPAECISKYGADATRAHMLFQAPISDVLLWNESQIAGTSRWLLRVLRLQESVVQYRCTTKLPRPVKIEKISLDGIFHETANLSEQDLLLCNEVLRLINNIKNSLEVTMSFNTVVSDCMKITNAISASMKKGLVSRKILLDSYKKLLIVMAPITPCTAEEAWDRLGHAQKATPRSIFHEQFPNVAVLESPSKPLKVFIDGKFCTKLAMHNDTLQRQEDIIEYVQKSLAITEKLGGSCIKKIVVKRGMLGIII